MNDQGMQAGQLPENEAVRQFLQLLMENRPFPALNKEAKSREAAL